MSIYTELNEEMTCLYVHINTLKNFDTSQNEAQ